MPLPFILAGAAIAAAGYGVKKGVDAKEDFDRAERYNNEAKKIYDDAQEKLEEEKEHTNNKLANLGELKVSIYQGSLLNFVKAFETIRNIDFDDEVDLNLDFDVDKQEMLDIKNSVLKMEEILGGTVAALGSGALAGFGALGGVGMLASASTGTAIASLSGAAATNATLAWLGGGSLAAGGFGMAGGMAVLGGIVAGPVLAVGGMMMASKAQEAKETARANLRKAEAAAEQMDAACVVLDGIYWRAQEMIDVLTPLNKEFVKYVIRLRELTDRNIDYRTYNDKEKRLVYITANLAQTVKNVCDAPIIDEDGEVTKKSKEVLEKAKEITKKIQEV